MWWETRYRMYFHATHEDYMNESFQRVRYMVAIAEMEHEVNPRLAKLVGGE